MNNINGGMLTGSEIAKAIEAGDIVITDCDTKRINPNSYNLRLHPELMCYTSKILDAKGGNKTEIITIPDEGIVLLPNKLYLGRTVERTYTDKYVPMITGRSSYGRLGMAIHITAGFGDIGFNGTWTLEITVVQPVKVYPFKEICQICWFTPAGDTDIKYEGRYQDQIDATASRVEMTKHDGLWR